MIRTAKAVWNGTGKEGSGTLSTKSGVLEGTPYSAFTRFESEDGKAGTNPEELIAAAHAGCFSMALSFQLGGAGFPPNKLQTDAQVKVEKVGDHYKITAIHLHLLGDVAGISEEKFLELANVAKVSCPVSQALSSVPMTMTAELTQS